MAPSTHLEAPPESPVQKPQATERLVLESRQPSKVAATSSTKAHHLPEEGSFQASMLEFNHMESGRRWVKTLISLSVNCAVVIIPLFMGLYFTDTLDIKQFASTFLVAPPPPPPPPPPPVAQVVKVRPMAHLMNAGKLVAPRVIPQEVKIIKEEALPDIGGGVAGGVPGGVAGGSMGGVIGGVIGGVVTAAPLAPKKEGPKAPVRVGGRVKAPRLIQRAEPAYPALARQVHLQGTVEIDAVIDEHGNIEEMKVISGPPLLIQSALDAVRRWKYEPTYLNDEAVPVQLIVSVSFRLSD
jgi:periplasmic protein TonB